MISIVRVSRNPSAKSCSWQSHLIRFSRISKLKKAIQEKGTDLRQMSVKERWNSNRRRRMLDYINVNSIYFIKFYLIFFSCLIVTTLMARSGRGTTTGEPWFWTATTCPARSPKYALWNGWKACGAECTGVRNRIRLSDIINCQSRLRRIF